MRLNPCKPKKLFNSHPHKEDDGGCLRCGLQMNFSTHILTRRMTPAPSTMLLPDIFSTHILTRRMTGFRVYHDFSHVQFSTHILTRRMTFSDTSSVATFMFFNSHPHKEDDELFDKVCSSVDFSTHILTRRMTQLLYSLIRYVIFQLTSSQGG